MKRKTTKTSKHNDHKCKKEEDEGKLNATIRNTKEKTQNPTRSNINVNVVNGKSITCSQKSPVEEVIKGEIKCCESDADMNHGSEVTSDPSLMNLSYAGAVKGEYLECWKCVYCCACK